MNNIRVYEETEIQYRKLNLFADMVTDYLKNGYMSVRTTYFDYGQDWKYTALLTTKNNDTWQSLCPRDYELILYVDSIVILDKIAHYYAEKLDEGAIDIHLYEVF